jgi:hypothetical protein
MSNAQRLALIAAGTQNKTVTGPRPPLFSAITTRPATLGNHDSIDTAFNGDLSKLMLPIEHRTTGAATLGQPATGYLYTPEAAGIYLHSYNASGHNQGTADNVGRTGATAMRVKVFNAGQGDHVAYNASGFVTGTKAGSTHWLANPAAVLFNGDLQAGADGVYLNPYETICNDGGFDVACVGVVNNFVRTNATGAKSTVWNGYRAQSQGTAACDAVVSATGAWRSGLDFTPASVDFGADQAAIALKTGQRIYFNANANASGSLGAGWRATGGFADFMAHSTASNELQFQGNSGLQFAVGRVASSVNYLRAAGAATGALPGLFANGSDTNISIGYRSKGTGSHIFYSADGATVTARVGGGGWFGIPDGVSAPGAQAGLAVLYVDSADSDLKIVFSDGTVKTIVTDT